MDSGDKFSTDPTKSQILKAKLSRSKHVLQKFLPYGAAFSSGLFSINLMAPNALERVLGNNQVLMQNVCFAVAHIGTGVYIDGTLQNKDVTPAKRLLYSSTGAVLFNYGSLLILANLKHYLPESKPLRIVVGVGVVAYLFWVGRDYLKQKEIPSNAL